jgi:nucleoside-diphosphate-sugar epimerase
MVAGSGMVAKRFSSYQDDPGYLVFASGVSNSRTIDPVAYRREASLLQQLIAEHPQKTLVYFSTCSIYDPGEQESNYIRHKMEMEELIRSRCKRFYIFRVSNLVGFSGNPNTILNFFIYHIRNGINFDLWINARRNLLDIDDMFLITDLVMKRGLFLNQVIPVASPVDYAVADIVGAIEKWYGKKASYVTIAKGHSFHIDISLTLPLIHELGLEFREDYLQFLLNKYYRH